MLSVNKYPLKTSMKPPFLFLAFFLLFLLPSVSHAQFIQGMGKVVVQSGTVTVLRQGKELPVGSMGSLLKSGDRILRLFDENNLPFYAGLI